MFYYRKKAFTLIELLVTTVIIGILAFVSIAVFNNYITNTKESVVKKVVSELYRDTILYAKENDVLYSELSIDDITGRFGIKEPEYGKIVYVASDNDFFYEVSLEKGEGWAVGIVSTVYADTHENSEYYAIGTRNGIEYFKSLSNADRRNFIRTVYFEESKNILDRNSLPEDFDYMIVSSPWLEKNGNSIALTGYINKIRAIKAIRPILGLGLREAKEFVESLPNVIKEGIQSGEVTEIKNKIEAAGGSVRLYGGEVGGGKRILFKYSSKINIKNVLLTGYSIKIPVIKKIKSMLGIGLHEAKGLVDSVPSLIKEEVTLEEAQYIKDGLEAVGGTVELIPA